MRSLHTGSLASMFKRSRMWPGRSPSTAPMLLPVKDLMAARTDSGVANNGEHLMGNGTILVYTGAGGCFERSTIITSLVESATESAEAASQGAAEMSPSIS